jgi:uncharacterized membrane protein
MDTSVSSTKSIDSFLPDIYKEALVVLLFLSAFFSSMLLLRFSVTGSIRYSFLVWNLLLAWIPALVSLWFALRLKERAKGIHIVAFLVWLSFLPNTFYLVTDLIHSKPTVEISILFDVVLLFGFACVGFALGLCSLGVLHIWLLQRTKSKVATLSIGAVILLVSFAIYLGRYLRWNSWDIVTNPLGLLIDVSSRVASPLDNPRTLTTTLLFFCLIASSYACFAWLSSYIYKKLTA